VIFIADWQYVLYVTITGYSAHVLSSSDQGLLYFLLGMSLSGQPQQTLNHGQVISTIPHRLNPFPFLFCVSRVMASCTNSMGVAMDVF
jgi:hypothetical protein